MLCDAMLCWIYAMVVCYGGMLWYGITFCLSPPESLAPLSPTEVCRPCLSFAMVSTRLHLSMARCRSSDEALALPYLMEEQGEGSRILGGVVMGLVEGEWLRYYSGSCCCGCSWLLVVP